MDIKTISKEINENAVVHGFWKAKRSVVSEKLMLIVSELGEAMEADRKDYHTQPTAEIKKILDWKSETIFERMFKGYVKDTFEDELADSVIRIFDLAEHFGIDLESHILAKHRYNKSRPYMHGKKY